MQDKPHQKVDLDQLLRLKRAEKPTPEFWDSFDRQLHQRRLQALVGTQGTRLGRLRKRLAAHAWPALPAGAAALLALGLIAFQGLPTLATFTGGNAQPTLTAAAPPLPAPQPTPATTAQPTAPEAPTFAPAQAETRFAMETLESTPADASGYITVAANTEISTRADRGVYYITGDLSADHGPSHARAIY